MNQNTIQALQDARDYVNLILNSTGPGDDGELALIAQLDAAIAELDKQTQLLAVLLAACQSAEATLTFYANFSTEWSDHDETTLQQTRAAITLQKEVQP